MPFLVPVTPPPPEGGRCQGQRAGPTGECVQAVDLGPSSVVLGPSGRQGLQGQLRGMTGRPASFFFFYLSIIFCALIFIVGIGVGA